VKTRPCHGVLSAAVLEPGARPDISERDMAEIRKFAAFLSTVEEMRPLAYWLLYPDEPAMEGGDA
jgi:hypothetical protein